MNVSGFARTEDKTGDVPSSASKHRESNRPGAKSQRRVPQAQVCAFHGRQLDGEWFEQCPVLKRGGRRELVKARGRGTLRRTQYRDAVEQSRGVSNGRARAHRQLIAAPELRHVGMAGNTRLGTPKLDFKLKVGTS